MQKHSQHFYGLHKYLFYKMYQMFAGVSFVLTEVGQHLQAAMQLHPKTEMQIDWLQMAKCKDY